jgi:hypothetical protein
MRSGIARNLPSEISALPLGHLQLSRYAHRHAERYKTIGQLLSEVEKGRNIVPHGATKSRQEIERSLEYLCRAFHNEKLTNWIGFRKSRTPPAHSTSIYFFSPTLRLLTRDISAKPLAVMNLRRRAIRALQVIGIKTVRELIIAAEHGIERFAAAGRITSSEIIASLDALSDSIDCDGSVDWIRYATIRGFAIFPERKLQTWSYQDFVHQLPSVAEAVALIRHGLGGLRILQDRILKASDSVPLREVGKQLGVTKARASFIEVQILKMLHRAFLRDEYRDCRFRLRPEFVAPIREMETALKRTGVMSAFEWTRQLQRRWGIRDGELGRAEKLICSMLGLHKRKLSEPHTWIISRTHRNAALLYSTSFLIKRLLTRDYADGLTLPNLAKLVGEKFGPAAPNQRELRAILRSLPTICLIGKKYRRTPRSLKWDKEQFVQILRQARKPMHIREIWLLAQRNSSAAAFTRASISSQLQADRRFIPISRSGFWALAEWDNVEARAVADIAAEILASSQKAMHEKELFRRISSQRPLRTREWNVIGWHLRADARFRQTTRRNWMLVKKPQNRRRK